MHTSRGWWVPLAALAAAVYLPLLATKPGRVVADTKTYLYLDPGRLLERAWSMWDPNIGLGTVSHQTIGYLWPMGPWYWAFERLGVPDWVAQRLWLGTILFAAGAGTYWLLRRVLGWAVAPAGAAAFVYACTPYVLTLAARISVILLPFAGLPWLIGLAALAVRRGVGGRARDRWRYPAAFALVVATVGSVNATALVLVGLGPLLWLVHARLTGEGSTGTILRAVGRIGVVTVAANLWWLAGLWAQSGYGIDILRYTETAETVASAAVAAEVLRGLGYWFFYGGDRLGPWIEPGRAYTQSIPLIGLTYALPITALLSAALVRWRERAFFVALVVVGTVAAVGAHPWNAPPPGAAAVKALLESDAGLAMRSLPRAAPLVALGVAALLGAGIAALGRFVKPASIVVALAAYLALGPLWGRDMVPSNLDRDEDIPTYWQQAAAALDPESNSRVLEVPGSDFASYRWGNTVDPVLPGLMDRPYVARELIPYGSAASAELVAALDGRIQERTLEPGALAVIARLMGVGDIVHRADLQYERFRTPRPYDLATFLDDAPGLDGPTGYGEPTRNLAIPSLPLIDERALLGDDLEARPPVEVYRVGDPVGIVRATPAGSDVVVAGDGEALVDVAATGLLDGTELVRYGASLGADGVAEAVDDGATLVVTDGNRRQGQRWSTVRDVLGYVEGEPALDDDPTDNRLPVFPDAEDGWETTAAPVGGATAAASSYGNSISFTPEFRAANVLDGDIGTEWRTGANADVRGERLRLTYDPPVAASSITFVQQLGGFRNRHITEVDVRVDGGTPMRVALDDASLTPEGQVVALRDETPVSTLEIEIVAESSGRTSAWGRPLRFGGLTQVGFAEVRLDGAPEPEPEALVLPPAATAAIDDDAPVAIVLSRWRTDPAEVVRDDPEQALARDWSQPVARTFLLAGTARPSPRATDDVLDELFGVTGPRVTPSSRLPSAVVERGSAALDGDPSTWWSPRFGDAEPSLLVEAEAPVTFDRVDIEVVDDGRRSVPTAIRIEADGEVVATVAPGPQTLPAPVTGTSFRFVVEEMDVESVTDWYSDAPNDVPPAIAELGIPALAVDVPDTATVDCRDDLLTIDGEPVAVRATSEGELAACDGPVELGAGDHELRAQPGWRTGVDLDQLVLSSELPGDLGAGATPTVEVLDDGRASVRVAVAGATPGEPFWLVLGQSYNAGWELDGRASELVDGYANGWLVTPDGTEVELTMTWRPQRVVSIALVLSAVAVLACLVLALRRPHAPRPLTAPPVPSAAPRSHRRWTVPVAAGVLSLVWIGPVSALVVTAAATAAVRWPAARRWLRLGPAAVLTAVLAYVVGRQAIDEPAAAFEWPAELATAHQPALVAIALLAVVVALDALSPGPSDGPEGPATDASSRPAVVPSSPGSAASGGGADRP